MEEAFTTRRARRGHGGGGFLIARFLGEGRTEGVAEEVTGARWRALLFVYTAWLFVPRPCTAPQINLGGLET